MKSITEAVLKEALIPRRFWEPQVMTSRTEAWLRDAEANILVGAGHVESYSTFVEKAEGLASLAQLAKELLKDPELRLNAIRRSQGGALIFPDEFGEWATALRWYDMAVEPLSVARELVVRTGFLVVTGLQAKDQVDALQGLMMTRYADRKLTFLHISTAVGEGLTDLVAAACGGRVPSE